MRRSRAIAQAVARFSGLLAVLTLAAPGCSQFDPPEKQISVAVADATAAMAASELSVDQSERERTTTQLTTTALTDMLKIVDAAATTLGTVPPENAGQRELRRRAISEVETAKAAILEAQYAVEKRPGAMPLAQTLADIDQVSQDLEALSAELPRPR